MITLRTAYRNRHLEGSLELVLPNGAGGFALPQAPASYELRAKHHKGTSPFAVATIANGKLAIAVTAVATIISYTFTPTDLAAPLGYGSLELISTAGISPPITTVPLMIVPEGTPYVQEFGEKLVVYGEKVVCVVEGANPIVGQWGLIGGTLSDQSDLWGALNARLLAAEKGAANGVTPLGADSKVPSVYLPSYVDDVLEYANTGAFPGAGETGKIYVAVDTGKTWRWSGSAYVEISASPGSTDAVPEGATNKYFTDARAQAALVTALAGKANTSHTHLLAAGATDVTITAANLNTLDDFADTTLHFHASDRARANHTGTQGIATVSGLQAALDAKANLAGDNTFTGNINLNGEVANALTTASTNVVWNMGFETHMSSGSVVAGFGIRNTKWLENASGIGVFGAAIDYVWDDPTAGSEDSRISFITQISGTAAYRFHVGNGVWLQGATGGDMGAGTINSTGYFLNGVDALASKANLASPALTGTPTAPTPALADDSTRIATTEYVVDKIAAATAGVSQVVGYSGNVTLANLEAGGVASKGANTFTGLQSIPSLLMRASGGTEGGQIDLEKPASGTTLSGNIGLDVLGDSVRLFDNGGTARGVQFHMTSLLAGVGSTVSMDNYEGKTFAATFGFSASASVATNTTALNNAIASAIATGRRRVILPSGTFQINNLTTISSAHDLIIEGAGMIDGGYQGATVLAVQTATGEVIRFDGSQHAGIKGCYIRHDVRRTADYSVVFGASCFHPICDLRIDYGFNGVRVFGTSEADVNVTLRYMYGTVGVMFDGDATYQSYGSNLKIEADNPYPISNNGVRKTYSNGLAVTSGEILWCPSGGRIYQVTGTGSLGASEPNTIGGTTGPDGFSTDISSGTATLKFVARTLNWIVNENYAYSIRIRKGSYVLNGYYGLAVLNTANTVASRPKWVYFEGETDHSFSHGVYAEKGESLYLEGAWLGSSLAGAGLYVQSTWSEGVSLDPSCRLAGNWLQGAFFGATNNVRVFGAMVEANSQAGSGTSDGLYFGGTIDIHVQGVRSRGGNQRYGIAVDTGGDHFVIKDNNIRGNVNAGVLNVPGTLANRRIVSDNVV
jgi:hypothetical protein